MDGVLVVDKPPNMSSAKVVSLVKHVTGAAKAGHTGTLDPFATGVMICCLNRATRLARFFLHADKQYEALLQLGVETDTQDATGNITAANAVPAFSPLQVTAVLKRFVGPIEQAPPVYSALKHHGVPLYKLARQGRPVQKPARRVVIHDIRLLEMQLPCLRLSISCTSGTYIRTLGADIGSALGCGGHLKQLKRTANAGFSIEEAVDLAHLKENGLSAMMDMAASLRQLPGVYVDKDTARAVLQGIPLASDHPVLSSAGTGFVKVLDEAGRLLAVLERKKVPPRCDYCCVFP